MSAAKPKTTPTDDFTELSPPTPDDLIREAKCRTDGVMDGAKAPPEITAAIIIAQAIDWLTAAIVKACEPTVTISGGDDQFGHHVEPRWPLRRRDDDDEEIPF